MTNDLLQSPDFFTCCLLPRNLYGLDFNHYCGL